MNVKLSNIFIPVSGKARYTKKELLKLEIKKEFIDQIGKRLNLTYLKKGNTKENLCYANSEQLRPEYKMFFSKSELINYLDVVLKAEGFDFRKNVVPFPKISNFFVNK